MKNTLPNYISKLGHIFINADNYYSIIEHNSAQKKDSGKNFRVANAKRMLKLY